jgi:hypothetical protein
MTDDADAADAATTKIRHTSPKMNNDRPHRAGKLYEPPGNPWRLFHFRQKTVPTELARTPPRPLTSATVGTTISSCIAGLEDGSTKEQGGENG